VELRSLERLSRHRRQDFKASRGRKNHASGDVQLTINLPFDDRISPQH